MRQRGASLVWTVIVCGVLMIVATTMSTAIVKESQMSVRMDDSARAYAAAESGVTWAKWCLASRGVSGGCFTTTNMAEALWDSSGNILGPYESGTFKITDTKNEVSYKVTITAGCSLDQITAKTCAGADYIILSRGSSGTVNRSIEYSLGKSTSEVAYNNDTVTSSQNRLEDKLTINGSFSAEFYYWQPEPANPLDTKILKFKNIVNDSYVGVELLANGFDIASSNGTKTTNTTIPVDTTTLSRPFGTRISLQYIKGVAFKMDVYSLSETSGKYVCSGTKTVRFDPDAPNLMGAENAKLTIEGGSVSVSDEKISTIYYHKYNVDSKYGAIANFRWSGITTTAAIAAPPAEVVSDPTGDVNITRFISYPGNTTMPTITATLNRSNDAGDPVGTLVLTASGSGQSTYSVVQSLTGLDPWVDLLGSGNPAVTGTISAGQTFTFNLYSIHHTYTGNNSYYTFPAVKITGSAIKSEIKFDRFCLDVDEAGNGAVADADSENPQCNYTP